MFRVVPLCVLVLLALCLRPALSPAVDSTDPAENLTYLTEEYRPFNYVQKGEPTGFSVALLKLIWDRMGVRHQPIEVLPWVRAYDRATRDPGIVLFSLHRTRAREHHFKWVGPIHDNHLLLLGRKGALQDIRSSEDLAGLRIGAVRDSAAASSLTGMGETIKLVTHKNTDNGLKMLEAKRIDLFSVSQTTLRGLKHSRPGYMERFETAYVLHKGALYYGFTPDVPDQLVQRFQEALDSIQKTPVFRNIQNYYLD